MSNDGKNRKLEFTEDQLELFELFRGWDKHPREIADNRYAEFIQQVGAGVAVNAFDAYEKFKRQMVKTT